MMAASGADTPESINVAFLGGDEAQKEGQKIPGRRDVILRIGDNIYNDSQLTPLESKFKVRTITRINPVTEESIRVKHFYYDQPDHKNRTNALVSYCPAKTSDVFILCINNDASLREAEDTLKFIEDPSTPVILLGIQGDMDEARIESLKKQMKIKYLDRIIGSHFIDPKLDDDSSLCHKIHDVTLFSKYMSEIQSFNNTIADAVNRRLQELKDAGADRDTASPDQRERYHALVRTLEIVEEATKNHRAVDIGQIKTTIQNDYRIGASPIASGLSGIFGAKSKFEKLFDDLEKIRKKAKGSFLKRPSRPSAR